MKRTLKILLSTMKVLHRFGIEGLYTTVSSIFFAEAASVYSVHSYINVLLGQNLPTIKPYQYKLYKSKV